MHGNVYFQYRLSKIRKERTKLQEGRSLQDVGNKEVNSVITRTMLVLAISYEVSTVE